MNLTLSKVYNVISKNDNTECDKKIDDYRYHLNYKVCVDCSDTEKYFNSCSVST